MNYVETAKEIIGIEISGMEKVRDSLDEGFDKAVRLILRCLDGKGKIVVTGIGKNLHIAEKISATLASTGSTSVVLNPTQAMHGDLGILNEDDALLVLSYSGESEELLALLPAVKRSGVSVISITGDKDSSLGRASDVVIPARVDREACPFNMAPTASTTATLAVGDALALVLLQARGFDKDDYAKLHPGGAIGRSLLLRVKDIMRSGDRMAVVRENQTVRDALLAMTRARSGSAAIVNDLGHVLGIFTDGDLRRHLSTDSRVLDLPVRDVMTPHPITVSTTQLAVDVLRIYEKRNIDDLLVVDEQSRLVGAVDIQDLPKFKIL